MTEQIYSESPRKIMQNKRALEEALNITISNKGNVIFCEGNAADEMIALEIIEAMGMGFSLSQAIDLKNEKYYFEIIPIKNIARRKNLSQVRARVIGTERGVLRTIESLTGCEIVLHDNLVGIIGLAEDVRKAAYALKKLIGGSKHANVYAYLEEEKFKERAGI